jgi:hypothetical protein
MDRLKFIWLILLILAGIVLAVVSFRYGLNAQRSAEKHDMAYAQATLAFAHYKTNERIESLLLRRCYKAALTEARELKNLQVALLYENLLRTENDPELVEYIKIRDPKLLETVLAGRVPELKPYTTTCP